MPWEDLCRIALKKSIMASSPWLTHRFTHTQIAIANQGPGVLLYTNPWGWLLGPTSLTPNLKLETTSTPAGVDGRAGTGTARPGGKGQGKDGRKIQTASVRVRGECRWRDSCGMRKTSTDTAAAAEVDWAGQPASDAGQLESGANGRGGSSLSATRPTRSGATFRLLGIATISPNPCRPQNLSSLQLPSCAAEMVGSAPGVVVLHTVERQSRTSTSQDTKF